MERVQTYKLVAACGICSAKYVDNRHPMNDCPRSGKKWLWFADEEPMQYITRSGKQVNVCDWTTELVSEEEKTNKQP